MTTTRMFPIRDEIQPRRTPVVTYVIIAITTLVLLLQYATPDLEAFLSKWALIPAWVDFSDIQTLYPFVTAIFLHGGFLHFVSNMWFLHIFGDNVEDELGAIKYVLFYLSGGVVAGLIQYLFIPDETIPMLGASGAIAAVLGYYFVKFPNHKIQTLVPAIIIFFNARLPAQFVLLFWFITQLFNGTTSIATTAASGGVAWWAHIGGFVFGYIVAKLATSTPKTYKPKQTYSGAYFPDEIIT